MLRATRKALRPGGRTAFYVIHLPPGLRGARRRRAIASGPSAVDAEAPYPTLLRQAGFVDIEAADATDEFFDTASRWLAATERSADVLAPLQSPGEFEGRQAERWTQLAAVEDGLLRRSLFVAASPAGGLTRPRGPA